MSPSLSAQFYTENCLSIFTFPVPLSCSFSFLSIDYNLTYWKIQLLYLLFIACLSLHWHVRSTKAGNLVCFVHSCAPPKYPQAYTTHRSHYINIYGTFTEWIFCFISLPLSSLAQNENRDVLMLDVFYLPLQIHLSVSSLLCAGMADCVDWLRCPLASDQVQ